VKRRLLAASTVFAALPAAAVAHDRDHHRGCRSGSCDRRIDRKWARNHRPKAHAALAVASWYGPGLYGNHLACGGTLQPTTFGVAHKALACGTKVRLCVKRCVTAPVIDRGPYVAGRTFDLTAPVKNAIGAGPLATVRFTVVG
jgi:rare lipoprotein A (peptidoglycan hydrolase)